MNTDRARTSLKCSYQTYTPLVLPLVIFAHILYIYYSTLRYDKPGTQVLTKILQSFRNVY